MVVLRFKDPRPREFKVPFNIRVGKYEVPIGLMLIFLVLLVTAIMNLLTKEVATDRRPDLHRCLPDRVRRLGALSRASAASGGHHEHLEQFNRQTTEEVTPASLGLTKPYRKLVAIRSPQNLFMLEKALAETDPETTGMVVMTAKLLPPGNGIADRAPSWTRYDQQLMTAVVQLAEKAGKEVKPLIVPTNNPLHAVLRTAKDLQVQELIMGASNKYTADEQLEQIAFYWINLHDGKPAPLTVRILSRDRDMYLDLGGGNRIPKISERKARSVAELRAAGVGVDRVLLVHDGSPASSDLFQARADHARSAGGAWRRAGRAARQGAAQRPRHRPSGRGTRPPARPRIAGDSAADSRWPSHRRPGQQGSVRPDHPAAVRRIAEQPSGHARRTRQLHRPARPLPVFLAAHPVIPQEVVDKTQ